MIEVHLSLRFSQCFAASATIKLGAGAAATALLASGRFLAQVGMFHIH